MRLERPLLGERIAIRSYTPEDLTFSTEMWFDPENGKYLSDPVREYVDEVYQKALDGMRDSQDGYYLIVELRDSGERIGTCCVFRRRMCTTSATASIAAAGGRGSAGRRWSC